MRNVIVKLANPSSGEKTAFVGGMVDGGYKSYTIQLGQAVELPEVMIDNLENAYVMGQPNGEKTPLEAISRYIVKEVKKKAPAKKA